MKKVFIIGLLLGGIIFGTSVYAVTNYLYKAEEVSYTPSDTTWNVSDVKDALNDLHDKAKNYIPAPSGNKQITISSTGTSSAVDVTNYATATCKTSGLYSSCSSCCPTCVTASDLSSSNIESVSGGAEFGSSLSKKINHSGYIKSAIVISAQVRDLDIGYPSATTDSGTLTKLGQYGYSWGGTGRSAIRFTVYKLTDASNPTITYKKNNGVGLVGLLITLS